MPSLRFGKVALWKNSHEIINRKTHIRWKDLIRRTWFLDRPSLPNNTMTLLQPYDTGRCRTINRARNERYE